MKIPQERTAQAPEKDGGAKEGNTMSPPTFQLSASPASPTVSSPSPIQRQPDESNGKGGGTGDEKTAPEGFVGPVRPAQSQELEPIFEEKKIKLVDDWDIFALYFNKEFASILHMFKSQTCGTDNESAIQDGSKEYAKIGEASGTELTGEELSKLFTIGQRDKITDFVITGAIPERLFNGDDVGATTAQQRILMAAHILAKGKYKPGSFEQGVHARMCWHWVHITHHYAGATPAGGLNRGMMGTADHNNDIVLGSGKLKSKYHGKRGDDSNIAEGSSHEEAFKKAEEREEADPSKPNNIKFLKTMPFDDFDKIEPGDWIWYYNANGSGVGSHSVIFSRWASDVLTNSEGVRYRKAICFSQGRPESGGREHNANLGESYSKTDGLTITPINYLTSVSADANPADTVDELLPKGSEKKEAALSTENEKYLTRVVEKRLKSPVDRSKVVKKLKSMNQSLIDGLGDRVTDGQRKMMEEANASKDIATLVRLYQKLNSVTTNSNILETNQEILNEKTDAEHISTSNEVAAAEAKIDQAEAELTAERILLEGKKAMLILEIGIATEEKDELDTAPEAKIMHTELKTLDKAIRAIERKNRKNPEFLASDSEYLYMKERREAVSSEYLSLIEAGKTNRKALQSKIREIRKLNSALGKLKKDVLRNGRKFTAEEKKREKAKKTLPFSMVHGGSWKGADKKGKLTGKLQDVFKLADFKEMLVDEKKGEDKPATE